MSYLENTKDLRLNPQAWKPWARSLLVIGLRYQPQHPAGDVENPEHLKIASYAKGRDYHEWLPERLSALLAKAKSFQPDLQFEIAADSKPLLERDLAQQAGLGWIGKNTCLIHREQGSFFLIGEALTNLDLDSSPIAEISDFCGTCNRCLEACPTGALIEPRLLDARKCISYLTIENPAPPPLELRSKISDHFFGCDICQDVCPWNEKLFRQNPKSTRSWNHEGLVRELNFFLTASNREIERKYKDSPILRARPRGLRKNAILVAANLKIKEVANALAAFQDHPELGELACWALAEMKS